MPNPTPNPNRKKGASGRPLKTMDEQAAARDADLVAHALGAADPCPSGIACPECGEELMDQGKLLILATTPTQKPCFCAKVGCGWKGLRRV